MASAQPGSKAVKSRHLQYIWKPWQELLNCGIKVFLPITLALALSQT